MIIDKRDYYNRGRIEAIDAIESAGDFSVFEPREMVSHLVYGTVMRSICGLTPFPQLSAL